MKQHIKEIIVVEGKNDTNTLQSFFDCDTIETVCINPGKCKELIDDALS